MAHFFRALPSLSKNDSIFCSLGRNNRSTKKKKKGDLYYNDSERSNLSDTYKRRDRGTKKKFVVLVLLPFISGQDSGGYKTIFGQQKTDSFICIMVIHNGFCLL